MTLLEVQVQFGRQRSRPETPTIQSGEGPDRKYLKIHKRITAQNQIV